MNPLSTITRPTHRHGFTLVELLVVIAIIGLLGAATTVLLPAIFGARGLSASADAVSNYLTQARSQAMGQNTYVIVGFYNSSTAGSGASDDLQIVGFRSLDGTYDPSLQAGNASSAKYLPISKVVHLPNVQLTQAANLPTNLVAKLTTATTVTSGFTLADAAANSISSATMLQTQTTSGTSTVTGNFTSGVIVFTPQGEALTLSGTPPATLANASYPQSIIIGLYQSHGGAIPAPSARQAQGVAIVLDGGSGKISEYRP